MVDKTRQVPKYRQQPVMMAWFHYKAREWTLVSTVDNQGSELPASWPKLDASWKAEPLRDNEASPVAIDDTHRLTLVRTAKATLTSATASGALTFDATEDELATTYAKGAAHGAIATNGELVRLTK